MIPEIPVNVGDQGSSSGLFDLFGSSIKGMGGGGGEGGLFHSFSDGFKFHINKPFMIDNSPAHIIKFVIIMSTFLKFSPGY